MTVYFARRWKDGLIKVGVSRNIRARMWELNADLVSTMRGGAREERLVRSMFRAHLVQDGSEWLRPEPEVLEFIAETEARKLRRIAQFAVVQRKAVERLVDEMEAELAARRGDGDNGSVK